MDRSELLRSRLKKATEPVIKLYELAERTGLHKANLSAFRNEKRPLGRKSLDILEKYLDEIQNGHTE